LLYGNQNLICLVAARDITGEFINVGAAIYTQAAAFADEPFSLRPCTKA